MNTYKRHRFPPDIISYTVWLYYEVAHRELMELICPNPLKAQVVRKERIFKDKAGGKNADRPGLERLLNRAEGGDEVLSMISIGSVPKEAGVSRVSSWTAPA